VYKVIKEVKWEAAHRLLNYKGKCANIHGHSYRAIFTFGSNNLNEDGMVVDFTILKKELQGWLDKYWDHALILNKLDPLTMDHNVISANKLFILDGNPTAENMTRFLFDAANNIFGTDVKKGSGFYLVSVEVFEGSKSSAMYTLDYFF